MAITANDVKGVYPTSADLSGFVTTAQVLVDSQLQGKGLTGALLDQITIYLAAHFASIGLEKGGLRSKKLGDAQESYKTPGDKDLGLKSTLYGQQALLLDVSGTLAGIGASAQSLPALFTVYSRSQPYDC
jgi:hypothetical protein